jgi:PAS domain S-box-containing protein
MRANIDTGARSRYLLVLVFVILAAGIFGGGLLYYRDYERRYQVEVESQLSTVADLKVGQLVQWRADRSGDASVFLHNPTFSRLVRRSFATPEDGEARLELRTWLEHVQAAYSYDRLSLLDAQGVERISTPDTPWPVAPGIVQRAAQVLRSGQVAFEDLYRDERDQRVYLALLVPVFDAQDGRALAVLALRIDPEQYLYPLINRWPTSSRSAETLIIRRDGNDVLYLNETKYVKGATLTLRISLEQTDVPAVRAALGQEGIVQGHDYRGVAVIADVRAVANSPWFLVVRMDLAEVYAPVREWLWMLVILVGALLVAAGAGVGLLWRQQSTRLYQERLAAAEAVQQSEIELQRAEAIGHLGHWRLDLRTNLFSWSEEMHRIYGVAREGFTPSYERVLQLVHPEDHAYYDQSMQTMRQDGTADLQYRVVRPTGEVRHVTGNVQTERAAAGQAVALFGTLLDTTELRQKERELQEKNAELQRFTYSVSHDLRSPLVTIKAFLGYLQKDMASADAARVEQDMLYMSTASDKMGQLLDELLEMSRVGRAVNPPVRVTLQELAQEALDVVAGRMAALGAQVQVGDEPVVLYGDRPRLAEIWQNLLENACKFMGDQAAPRIEIGGERRGYEVVFFVRDNGMGIDPRYHARVFDLFEKLDPKSEGTGLGLALVKRIVELYGGRIWLESQGRGQGSCFWFTLPGALARGDMP